MQSSVYYTFLKGNYDFNLNGFLGLPTTKELYNYALQSNLIGFFSNYTFSKTHFNWTTGIHGNIYDRQHIGSEKTLGKLYKNYGYKNESSVLQRQITHISGSHSLPIFNIVIQLLTIKEQLHLIKCNGISSTRNSD